MEALLLHSGSIAQIALAFLTGILTLLTPCVYPLLPITLSICGARSALTKTEAFFRALTYCLGLIVAYTTLGIIAVTTSALFGSLIANAAPKIIVTIFLIVLFFYSLELIELPFIARLQNKANKIQLTGAIGIFFMGAISGLIAAPCVGPLLVSILTVAASAENRVFGALLLFSYSLGMSVPFLLLGTFAPLISRLPKAGLWMKSVKFLTAVGILFVIGFLHREFFNSFHIPSTMPLSLLGFGFVGLVLARLAFQKGIRWLRVLSAVLVFFALYPLVFSHITESVKMQTGDWLPTIEDALGHSQKKPIMVDLYAEWCASCLEFESDTFKNPTVQELLKNFHLVRVNFTKITRVNGDLAKRFDVQGLPTILFLDSEGTELRDFRVNGFLKADEFSHRLGQVLTSASKKE